MPDQKISKSLPKRVSNERLKARRQASWNRSQARKKARREAQEARHKANLKRLAAGEPTVHEAKKIAAKERRKVSINA